MRAFGKSAVRLFRKHILRLITIAAIVMVSVGFMSGLGEVKSRIKLAVNEVYETKNVSDLNVKSTFFFSSSQRKYLVGKFGEDNVTFGACIEEKRDDGIYRKYGFDLTDTHINDIEIIDGRLPSSADEIAVERSTNVRKSHAVGDVVTLSDELSGTEREYTVCGVIYNPQFFHKIEEHSFAYEGEYLSHIVYFHYADLPVANDAFITLGDRTLFDAYSKAYKKQIDTLSGEITDALGESVKVLTLYENPGLYSMVTYADKVGIISIIFIVFFLLVTMLVVYSNMSRLLDEERGQIACLKTLGFGNAAIVARYALFVLVGTVAGGLLALPIGIGLTFVIYRAFNMHYVMPPFPGIGVLPYYVITFAIIIVSMLLLTHFTGMNVVSHKPVVLLARKAPKAGKKTFIEHIAFIWNRLSFKHKSTMRNVLLFKSRFFMTVISIIGSTVLVLAGLGLADCSLKAANAQSLLSISVALIVFSAMLCALVIYNITNINVSERRREIASLMVLGYTDREVTGYIFREVYVMCFAGAVLGVPLGAAFMTLVFDMIDFGAIADINWWTWIVAPAVTMLFSFFSTLLLRTKITKTDMNAALKTLE